MAIFPHRITFHRSHPDSSRLRFPSPRDHTPVDNTTQNTTVSSNTPLISPVRPRRVVRTAVIASETLSTDEAVEGVVVVDPHDEALKQLEMRWLTNFTVIPGVFIDRKLADGTWSIIFCVDGTSINSKFALKATPMIGALAEGTIAQIATMRSLQHPNIITFHDTFIAKVARTKFMCIKMDYCKKGTLKEFVEKKKAKEKEKDNETSNTRICDFLLQIASALTYIHEKGVLHGDLRLDNILRTSSDQMKLTNFATTSAVPHHTDAALTITGGQQMYAPPEWVSSVYTRRPLQSSEVPEASYDMWSFGCVLSELVTLRLIKGDRVPPTEALATNDTALDGVLQDLNTAQHGVFSAIGRALLQTDPDERMTAPAATATLEALMPQLTASHSTHRHLQLASFLSSLAIRS